MVVLVVRATATELEKVANCSFQVRRGSRSTEGVLFLALNVYIHEYSPCTKKLLTRKLSSS